MGNVSVDDDVAGLIGYVSGDTDGDGWLDLTEIWIFSVNYTIPILQEADIINTGIAEGTDSLGFKVSNTSSHSVKILHPDPKLIEKLEELENRDYPTVKEDWLNFQLEHVELDESCYINCNWQDFLSFVYQSETAFKMGLIDKFEVFFDKSAETVWCHIPYDFYEPEEEPWIVIYYKTSE